MRISFGNDFTDTSLDTVRSLFQSIIEEEVAHLKPKKPRCNRRSSILHILGPHYSDASSVFTSISPHGSVTTETEEEDYPPYSYFYQIFKGMLCRNVIYNNYN